MLSNVKTISNINWIKSDVKYHKLSGIFHRLEVSTKVIQYVKCPQSHQFSKKSFDIASISSLC